MATADYVEDRAAELLTAATAAVTLARTGNAIPSRVYRSHDAPAVDFCEDDGLLVVYLDNPSVDFEKVSVDRAVNTGQQMYVPILRLVVELWRCVPTLDGQGIPPTVTALDTSAQNLMRDMWALHTGLRLRQDAGNLFPAGMGCANARFGPPVPRSPGGGVGGWLYRVAIPLNDSGPAI